MPEVPNVSGVIVQKGGEAFFGTLVASAYLALWNNVVVFNSCIGFDYFPLIKILFYFS